MPSTIAMRATEEPSRIQTTFEPYTGNMVITPSMYVAPRGVVIYSSSEFDSKTHTSMLLTDQLFNCCATMIEFLGHVNPHASMQVSCTLCKYIALNNTEFGRLRHLSVYVV